MTIKPEYINPEPEVIPINYKATAIQGALTEAINRTSKEGAELDGTERDIATLGEISQVTYDRLLELAQEKTQREGGY